MKTPADTYILKSAQVGGLDINEIVARRKLDCKNCDECNSNTAKGKLETYEGRDLCADCMGWFEKQKYQAKIKETLAKVA